MMIISKLSSKFIIFGDVIKKIYCKRVFGQHASLSCSGTNSTQKNSTGSLLSAGYSDLQHIIKFTPIKTTTTASMHEIFNKSQLLLKNYNMPFDLNSYSKNFLLFEYPKCQRASFHSLWVAQFIVFFCLMYYYSKSIVFAAEYRHFPVSSSIQNSIYEKHNTENAQTQDSNKSQDGSHEASQDYISPSNKDNQSSNHESSPDNSCNADQNDLFPTNARNNDGTSESTLLQAETEEPNIFSPVIIDELPVSSPVELNDAQSLTHQHMVMQSAAIAAESSLMLLLRVSRAQLAIMENYKHDLEQILQLLQYQAELLRRCGSEAQHSYELQQITAALVVARVREQSWEQQYKDVCLLMRVAHQSSDTAQLCAHIAGAEQDALAVAAAVAALKPKIDHLQQEIRTLKMEVRAQHVEVIRSEQEGRQGQPADVPPN